MHIERYRTFRQLQNKSHFGTIDIKMPFRCQYYELSLLFSYISIKIYTCRIWTQLISFYFVSTLVIDHLSKSALLVHPTCVSL